MGVFGEKHTSLTREQKRQLIHQADTHKLRPTEVCDWVQATWGLRIARVTVYSILHKQRASLMAGHKDLYQTMQNSLGLTSSSPSTTGAGASEDGPSTGFSNTMAQAHDACLLQSKDGQRVNKYRVSPNKNKNKGAAVTSAVTEPKSASTTANKKTNNADNSNNQTGKNKRNRSISVVSDQSSVSTEAGEVGARWEGQLKRVREPASVELDRAMVAFLKSPASVDSQGRRLNDAELQSHALRLAQSIPSASRMRCSFGWLRHFKRRLGVQWATDRLGRYRWIVEMDHQEGQSLSSSTSSTPLPSSLDNNGIKVKLEPDGTERVIRQGQNDDDEDDDDQDEEYHSTHEFSPAAPSPKKRSRMNDSSSLDAGQSFAAAMLSTSAMMPQPHYDNSSVLSVQPAVSLLQHQQHSYQQHQQRSQHQSPQAIMDAFPSLFGSMPSLQMPCLMSTISPMATALDPTKLSSSTSAATAGSSPAAAFGMSVDGRMRKVPSKEEAYEMLQSLLMYYEQDHSYIGEQQTLLLPRWIHQQRQIMHQTQETEARIMWMRQQQQQMQYQQQQQAQAQLFGTSFPSFDSQSLLEHGQLQQQLQQNQLFFRQQLKMSQQQQPQQQSYHRYHSSFSSISSDSSSSSSTSPSSLSPISPTLSSPPPMPALNRLDEFLTGTGASVGDASAVAGVEDELNDVHSSTFSTAGLWPLAV